MFRLVRPCFPSPGRAVLLRRPPPPLLAHPSTAPLRLAARSFSLNRPQTQPCRADRLPSHQRRPYNYNNRNRKSPFFDPYTHQVRLQAAKPLISEPPL